MILQSLAARHSLPTKRTGVGIRWIHRSLNGPAGFILFSFFRGSVKSWLHSDREDQTGCNQLCHVELECWRLATPQNHLSLRVPTCAFSGDLDAERAPLIRNTRRKACVPTRCHEDRLRLTSWLDHHFCPDLSAGFPVVELGSEGNTQFLYLDREKRTCVDVSTVKAGSDAKETFSSPQLLIWAS